MVYRMARDVLTRVTKKKKKKKRKKRNIDVRKARSAQERGNMVPAIAHPIVFGGKQFPRVCAGRARVCLKLDFALIIATSRSSFLATKRRSDSSCKSCPMLRDAFVGEKDWCASEGVFAIISKIWKRSFFFLLFFPSFVKWKSVVVEKTGNENEKGERERERKREREIKRERDRERE